MTVPGGGSDPLARTLEDEWNALGLMSYHGIGTAHDGETMWRADLDPEDVGKIRALLSLAAWELAGLRERLAVTEAANKELDDRNRWRWPAERDRADALAEQLSDTEAHNGRLSARLDRAVDALRQVRCVFPQGVCSDCIGFEHEVMEANGIIDDALAGHEAERKS